MNGHLVISLDLEKRWGIFDQKPLESYKPNLINVDRVVDRLLELSEKYGVKLTFATVGFLFAENKQDLLSYAPEMKPTYKDMNYSPYGLLDDIGEDEADDPYHYGQTAIQKIKAIGTHEISTHTFCHFYCHEWGQTPEQFEADLKAAIEIAKSSGIDIKTIVFPRNMIEAHKDFDIPYLDICEKYGLTAFRGKEKAYIYNIHTTKPYHGWYIFKFLRILDSYINVTGFNTYKLKRTYPNRNLVNLPSSRLLRVYNKKLKALEPLKLSRIKNAMRHAAKRGELFHLWWHPHNFGMDMDENFDNLEDIFKEYARLHDKYDFESDTMAGLSEKILQQS